MKYDVFISYRRETGLETARLVQQGLEHAGCSCFLDFDSIRDGDFRERIFTAIDNCSNVVFILSDGALDRCAQKDDWVRIELEHALTARKPIIPVAASERNRAFPDSLPESLLPLKSLQISPLDVKDYYRASIHSIISERLRGISIHGKDDDKEAEDVFLSKARRFKSNDGVIDERERTELEELADRLKISIVRREHLIERVENENQAVSLKSANTFAKPNDNIVSGTTPSSGRFAVLAGRQVSFDDIVEAVGLDAISYPECYRGEPDTCRAWALANPDIYVMLRDMDSGKIVAYINAMPVTDECYDQIKNGTFIDVDISPNSILPYDMPYPYSIYFSSVVIHPEYRNSGVFKFLFDAILKRFLELGSSEVFIRRMLADAVSPEGEKFCKLFGMERLGPTAHGSMLYEVSMIPPKFRITSKMTKQLHDYYAAKYREEPYLFDDC